MFQIVRPKLDLCEAEPRRRKRHNWRQIVEDYADNEDVSAIAKKHGMRLDNLVRKFRGFGIDIPVRKRGRESKAQQFLKWLYDLRDEVEKGDTEIALMSIDGMIRLQGRQSSVGAE